MELNDHPAVKRYHERKAAATLHATRLEAQRPGAAQDVH